MSRKLSAIWLCVMLAAVSTACGSTSNAETSDAEASVQSGSENRETDAVESDREEDSGESTVDIAEEDAKETDPEDSVDLTPSRVQTFWIVDEEEVLYQDLEYDENGRLISRWQDNSVFGLSSWWEISVQNTYDEQGNLLSTMDDETYYVDGEIQKTTVTQTEYVNHYDDENVLQTVEVVIEKDDETQSFERKFTYNEAGLLMEMEAGDGLASISLIYDDTGFISEADISTGETQLRIEFICDENGYVSSCSVLGDAPAWSSTISGTILTLLGWTDYDAFNVLMDFNTYYSFFMLSNYVSMEFERDEEGELIGYTAYYSETSYQTDDEGNEITSMTVDLNTEDGTAEIICDEYGRQIEVRGESTIIYYEYE